MTKPLLLAITGILAFSSVLSAQVRDLPMLVDAQWLSENLDAPSLIVIQVDQQRDGYDAGHIPGAVFLPYDQIAVEVDGLPVEMPHVAMLTSAFAKAGIRDDTYVVFYGAPLSAARAWVTADFLGIGDRAAMLDGGITAWQAAGLPLSTDPPAPRSGDFSLSPQRFRIVDADWMVENMENPEVVMIDARPLNEYTGEDGGRNAQFLAGHIPGARHLFWEELIVSREDPRLLPIEELRARFEAAGAEPGKAVAVYCFIGMRASMSYFVARMLDYETYLYDGSWHDWSARNLPFEAGPDPHASGR